MSMMTLRKTTKERIKRTEKEMTEMKRGQMQIQKNAARNVENDNHNAFILKRDEEREEEEGGADEQRHCQVSEEETEQRWQAQRKLCLCLHERQTVQTI